MTILPPIFIEDQLSIFVELRSLIDAIAASIVSDRCLDSDAYA